LTALIVGLGVMLVRGASPPRICALTGEELLRQTLGDQSPTWALLLLGYLVIAPLGGDRHPRLARPAIGNVFSNIYAACRKITHWARFVLPHRTTGQESRRKVNGLLAIV